MQMEVIELQCHSNLEAKLLEGGFPDFYKYLPTKFKNIQELAFEILSMFLSI